MTKPWRQTRLFICSVCNTQYLHDHAYADACFKCPARDHKGIGNVPKEPKSAAVE